MEESIKKTFANQAKFEVMRSVEMQARGTRMIADEEACGEEIPLQCFKFIFIIFNIETVCIGSIDDYIFSF